MKKSIAILLAITSLSASVAMADPSIIVINFTCPVTSGSGIHTLSNFGARVAGYGTETINGNPALNTPYFTYIIPTGGNVPHNLTTYSSSGTDFDSTNSIVSCSYTSSGSFDPFTVVYQMTNGNGGQIGAQTLNTISINQFLGVNKG